MKVISLFVSSLDGKVTRGENIPTKAWNSKEDQEYFKKTWQEQELIVIGSGTFKPAYAIAREGQLRIILTSKPKSYEQYMVSGKLEFTDEKPRQFVSRLEKEGYKQMLLVAGPKVTTAFFKDNLIDELWLTLEPRIFGKGKSIAEGKLDVQLQLYETKQLNKQGTMLLKYKVLKATKLQSLVFSN